MVERLVLASGNKGKLKEFHQLCAPLGLHIVAQSELGISEADEPYETFVENALAKARHASRAAGLPALADDSGICVPALGGAPGVRSARFAEAAPTRQAQDEKNNQHLLQLLASSADRSAYYTCVIVLVRHPKDPQPLIAQGHWEGVITDQPRGEGGFGYDPYFYLPTLKRTAAEISEHEKNQLSHRGQAMMQLVEQMRGQGLIGTDR